MVTGVDGRFTLASLAPGTYAVRTYRPGGGEAIAEHVQTGTSTRLVIKPTGTIEGVVRRSDNLPLAELEVSLADKATGLWRSDTFFQTDGRFIFHDLPAGSYTLEVTAAGGHGTHVLALAEGAKASGVSIVLDALVAMHGRVVDRASGKPIAGVDMYAQLVQSAASTAMTRPAGISPPRTARSRCPACLAASSCSPGSRAAGLRASIPTCMRCVRRRAAGPSSRLAIFGSRSAA